MRARRLVAGLLRKSHASPVEEKMLSGVSERVVKVYVGCGGAIVWVEVPRPIGAAQVLAPTPAVAADLLAVPST